MLDEEPSWAAEMLERLVLSITVIAIAGAFGLCLGCILGFWGRVK